MRGDARLVHDDVMGDIRRLVMVDEGLTTWVLIGPHGATQYAYQLMPVELATDMPWGVLVMPDGMVVMGFDVGYHAYKPHYDGQRQRTCAFLVGQDHCFYAGSSLTAMRWMVQWAEADFATEWVWARLYNEYRSLEAHEGRRPH